MNTFGIEPDRHRVHTKAFRILAPLAAKRTPFQKYGRPQSVAVMDRKPFDIEYKPFRCRHTKFFQ